MAEVFDFYSKNKRADFEPTKAEDADLDSAILRLGKYVGKLPKDRAENLRGLCGYMEKQRAYIDQLVQSWQISYELYASSMSEALTFLNVDDRILEASQEAAFGAYVDNKGNMWLIEEKNREAFEKAISDKVAGGE